MAQTIRGLTVEISADASKFNKQMSAVRKDTKSTQSELNALQKSLELDFDETKFTQAQKKAQEAIDVTADRANLLKQRLAFLEENDSVNTSHYRQIQSELAQCELEGQKLQKQLESINQLKFTNLAKNIESVGETISAAGKATAGLSVAATGVITALGALGSNAISTADDVSTLATQYQTTAEAIQKFNYVALQTDTSADDLYKALVKIRSGISDISSNTTSSASTALKQLNIDLNSFDGSEEQFYAIIESLADMEDKTQMVTLANDIFGEELANKLLPLIYSGSEAIEEYASEYDSLGALTNDQVSALAEFDNVLNKIKTQLSNIAAQIGASLLPIMQQIASIVSDTIIPKLQKLAEWFNSLTLSQQEFIAKALLLVAALSPVLLLIGKLTTGVGQLIEKIPKINSALSSLMANPIALAIAAVVAILVVLYTQCEEFRESINNLVSTLMSALQPILSTITGLISTLMELLTPIINTVGKILALVINMVVDALTPFFEMLSLIFELIQPLLEIALVPLQVALTALEVPLQMIGTLLEWLQPLFQMFAKIVKSAFDVVLKVVNIVLSGIESAVNFVIDIINGLIDTYNALLGWLFGKADNIGHVSLQIGTSTDSSSNDLDSVDTDSPYNSYDGVDSGSTSGDTYNNDYSTNTKNQDVTVVIQNYADEVDVDDLIRQINIKLAEEL